MQALLRRPRFFFLAFSPAGPASALRRTHGPRPDCVARALSFQSRPGWLYSTDCVPPRKAVKGHRTMEPCFFSSILVVFALLLYLLYHTTPKAYLVQQSNASQPRTIPAILSRISLRGSPRTMLVRVCVILRHLGS